MAGQTLRPTAISVQTGCTGVVGNLTNDPDSGTDGNWVTANSNTTSIVLAVYFPDASGPLTTGSGLQEIRALVACTDTGNTPDAVTMEVWEGDPDSGGTLRTTLVNASNPLYGSGTVISGTWDASLLSTQDANADVHVRITCTADTDPVPQRCSLNVDSIEWNVEYDLAATEIAVKDSTHAHSADSPAISETQQIKITDSTSAHSADSPAISQSHQIAVTDSTHAHSAAAPAISQNHQIAVTDSEHAHSADAPGVSEGTTGVSIAIADAAHTQSAGTPFADSFSYWYQTDGQTYCVGLN